MGKGKASSSKKAEAGTQRNTRQPVTDSVRDVAQPGIADTKEQTRDAIRYILILFLASRALLTVIGVLARKYLGQLYNVGDIDNYIVNAAGEVIISPKLERTAESLEGVRQIGLGTGYTWLDIWGVWDTRWYVTIAKTWYSAAPDPYGQEPHAFLPLYPILMKIFGLPFGNSYYGGLIVSNLALLVGAWFLYKVVCELKGHAMGKRAVLFMFLYPTAFMLSAVFTEALFVALSVGAFYCARRKHWLVAGLLGGLSALTRLPGMFIAVLLFLEYMRQRQFRLPEIRADVLWLALVPLGTVLFMLTGYMSKGSLLASFQAQAAWGGSSMNPITMLWNALDGTTNPPPVYPQNTILWPIQRVTLGFWTFTPLLAFGAVLTIYVFAVLAWGYKHLDFPLLVWCALLVLIPLARARPLDPLAMPRYMLVVFPIFLIMAHLRPGRVAYYATVAVMVLVQVCAMVLWTNNYHIL